MRELSGLVIAGLSGLVFFVAGFAIAKQPPPVKLDLGPVVPTPVPSPVEARRIRMITSFTLQNKPDGNSIVSFEATDFARLEREKRKEEDQYRILAAEVYSLVEPKKELRPLRDRILSRMRELEVDLLAYVEKAGPPRQREPITGSGSMR